MHTHTHFYVKDSSLTSAHSFNNCQLYSCDKLFSHLHSCPTASTVGQDNTDFWNHTDYFSVSLKIFKPLTKLWEGSHLIQSASGVLRFNLDMFQTFPNHQRSIFPIWLDWYTWLVIGFLPILHFASGSTPGNILHSTALVKTQSRYRKLSICSYLICNLSMITELVSMF